MFGGLLAMGAGFWVEGLWKNGVVEWGSGWYKIVSKIRMTLNINSYYKLNCEIVNF